MALLLWYSLRSYSSNKLTMLITPRGQSTGSHEDYEPHAQPCADGGGGKDRFVPLSPGTLGRKQHYVTVGDGRNIKWCGKALSGVKLPDHSTSLTNH